MRKQISRVFCCSNFDHPSHNDGMATQRKKKSAPKKTKRGKKVVSKPRKTKAFLKKELKSARRIQKDLGPLKEKDGWVLIHENIVPLPFLNGLRIGLSGLTNLSAIQKAVKTLISETQEACERSLEVAGWREDKAFKEVGPLIVQEARRVATAMVHGIVAQLNSPMQKLVERYESIVRG